MIAEVDQGVVAAVHRLEHRLRLAGLRIVQKRCQLVVVGDGRKTVELKRVGGSRVDDRFRADARMEYERIVARACDGYRNRLGGRAVGAVGVVVGNTDHVGLGHGLGGRAGGEIEVPSDRILAVGRIGDRTPEIAGAAV